MLKRSGYLNFIILTLILIIACKSPEKKKNEQLTIVTTTGMVADLVNNIAGDSAEVIPLMGAGVDPHLYKATQGDLSRLREADIIFYNGLHLEGKMGEIFEKLSLTTPVTAIAERVPEENLLDSPDYPGNYDPHIWFDVQIWKSCIPVVLEQLSSIKGSSANYFLERAQKYEQELDSLDAFVHAQLALIPDNQRILITAHDAFSYFGKAYNMEVRGLQGISTLTEFGLKDRTELVNFIVSNEIPAVFVESSVPKKNIESIVEGCKARGHNLVIGGSLYSDALGELGTTEGTYIGAFKANIKQMVDALGNQRNEK